jgi:SAM-dependent methyltransferase
MSQARPDDWWQSLYDETVAELFLVRTDPDELSATVAFLWGQLAAVPGCTLFDQCCGVGSLSTPLALRGARVVGVDQCEAYVRRARRDADAHQAACSFVHGDAFAFVPEVPCRGAFNWGSGFGNADDARNRLMLRRAFESLEPGGGFVLDYQNIPRVLRQFQRCLVRRGGDTLLLRESELDLAGGSLNQLWTFVGADGRRVVRRSALRLYLPHDLADLLCACGFVGVEFHGGVRGEALGLDSPRCVAVARRPDA